MKKLFLAGGLAALLVAGWVTWLASRPGQRAVVPPPPASAPGAQPAAAIPAAPAAGTLAAQTARTPAAGSNDLLAVVVGVSGAPFAARQAALRTLRPPLTPEEVAAVYAYLRDDTPHPATLPGGEHVLKNDLLALLTRQEPPPEGLLRELVSLSRDPSQNAVVRDYALQHLAQCAEQPTNRFSAGLDLAHATLWEALSETSGTFAGTALLGLQRLAARDPGFATQRLDTAAVALARDPNAHPLSRTTALQVCAQRGLNAALPEAVELAQTGATLPLRAAAVAALGNLGRQGEAALLEQLQTDTNALLQHAATASLKRLRARLNTSNQPPVALPTRTF